ncbi:MAG: hypothetical protein ABIG87_01150 [Patescibacteria group bacterium]
MINKKTLQDVTPPQRSIQDIPIPDDKNKKPRLAHKNTRLSGKKKTNWKKFLMLMVVLILLGFFLFLLMVSSVVVTVHPHYVEQRTDASFIAVSEKETGGVPFDIIMLDETGERTTAVASEEEVNEKASGSILVFNDFGTATQRLIKNTRFETPEGLVYRVQESIIVPGQTKDSTGKLIPGSIEVVVYADQPGEKYNIGLFDFTIPGFKGSAQYDKFYARSKTAMAGGFKGVKKIASEEDVEKTRAELTQELTQKLTETIKLQIPDNFILYDDGIFTESKFMGTGDLEDGVGVKEKVSVYAIVFDKKNLSKYIAEQTVSEYEGGDIIISNLNELAFEIKNKTQAKPWVEGRFVFSLKGKTDFEWLFDAEKLKNDFVGRLKSDTDSILSKYKSIELATVVIKPFWKSSFPRSTGKIEIVKILEK